MNITSRWARRIILGTKYAVNHFLTALVMLKTSVIDLGFFRRGIYSDLDGGGGGLGALLQKNLYL
jgi:hypothetical protein